MNRVIGNALLRHVDEARSCVGKAGRANQNLHFVPSESKRIGQDSALRLLEFHKDKRPFFPIKVRLHKYTNLLIEGSLKGHFL